jgi:2-polyprenyl-3-methyl-5-hydroxy-6-metoxy-1,4-benzoquinol methylase
MTPDSPVSTGYRYSDAKSGHHHGYLFPTISKTLDEVGLPAGEQRLFELGCGNGSMAHALSQRGWHITGVDPSAEGIVQARAAYPGSICRQALLTMILPRVMASFHWC